MTSLRRSTFATLVILAACGDNGSADGSESASTTPGTASSEASTTATPTSDPPTGSASESADTGEATLTGTGQTATSDPTITTDPTTTDPTATSDPTDTTTGEPGCAPGLPTFADGKTPTSTLLVLAGAAPGGDGSEAKPFDTLAAALAVAKPGTQVRVNGDLPAPTYQTDLKATPDSPIWISGEPGARIGALTFDKASSIIIEDLEITGSPEGHALHFFFADHMMMRRLKIHDTGLGCIKGSQTTEAYVEDSELWAAGKFSVHPVLDYVGVNTGHIVRSEFREGPGVMIMLKGGTSDLLFAWNEVHAQTAAGNALSLGQSTGPQFFQPIDAAFEGLRIVAYANLLHDLVGAPVAFEGCKDCAAVRNTVWNCSGPQLVRFLPGAAGMDSGAVKSLSEGCRFTGNIVVGGQPNGASLNADDGNLGANNVLDHNVFLKPGAINWWGVIPQEMMYSTYDQDPNLDAGGVPGNVGLVDGKGPTDLADLPFADVFVQDAKGACVQQPPDIGAFDVP